MEEISKAETKEAMGRLMELIRSSGTTASSSDVPPRKRWWEMTDDEKRNKLNMDCDSYNSTVGDLNERDGVECEKCKNKGYLLVVVDGMREPTTAMRACSCMQLRTAIMRIKNSGLSTVIKTKTFATFEASEPWQQTIKQTAEAFVNDPEARCLFMGGSSGSGKSHLCTAVTGTFLRRRKAAYYMQWQSEVAELKRNALNDDAYQRAIDRIKTIPVLYIDDFFKPVRNREGVLETPSAADVRIAYEIINHRYNDKSLITIISSERFLTEIASEIDEATGGRIAEMATPRYLVNIGRQSGRNYRLKDICTV